ncbi:hypothetical protein LWC05_01865 [Acetobacter sicerae]|uniref:Uncharacterized protein n=1 Tax=Acetobacter sicerae TaxID=85325 RepID=A0ABS8VPW5_9PROT|nr:hypothetical protein [Acetobacter sicerae]MCE0742645.1 hypothetical protein [Acetobacter sicerae]NHN90693.1 hypothetical protein [Acetobacter sicerae]
MRPIRRFPISSTSIVRIVAFVAGVLMLVAATRFVAELPSVMPGNAAGTLVLVALGTIFVLAAIWLGV